MLSVRYPLSSRTIVDLLHESRIYTSHETVLFWWQRFGPLFASKFRKRRVSGMQWRDAGPEQRKRALPIFFLHGLMGTRPGTVASCLFSGSRTEPARHI